MVGKSIRTLGGMILFPRQSRAQCSSRGGGVVQAPEKEGKPAERGRALIWLGPKSLEKTLRGHTFRNYIRSSCGSNEVRLSTSGEKKGGKKREERLTKRIPQTTHEAFLDLKVGRL